MTHKLLILSDSHLFGSRDQELFGVTTYDSLQEVCNHIRGLRQSYDLVVASGDLSEDGHARAYEDFYALTKGLGLSSVWMTGNHDQFDNVPSKLANSLIHPEWHMDPWSLIFLDTSLAGMDEGVLAEKELDRLEAFLQTYGQRPVLIFLHHQPVNIGSEFIDVLGLQNKQVFWELISPYTNIKGVFFGHVHQQFDGKHNGIPLYSTPSTSIQFKPHSSNLDFDVPSHGYRTMSLNADGTFDTHIIRIAPNIKTP